MCASAAFEKRSIMAYRLISEKLIRHYYIALNPLVELLIKFELNPNWFTTASLILGIGAGICYGTGNIRWAGALLLLCGILDTLDGTVARATNRVTRFGALYDSTLDRYAEVIAFFGLAFYFVGEEMLLVSVAICVALAGSLMVSYVRARAEGLGFTCKMGMLQRTERLVFMGFASLIHEWVLIIVIFIIAVMANFTAFQRLYHVWATENGKRSERIIET